MSPEILDQQFRIHVDSTAPIDATVAFDGISIERVGSTAVNGLPVIPLLDESGSTVGALLGWPLDQDRRHWIAEAHRIVLGTRTIDDVFDQDIAELAGSFLAVLSIGGKRRVYLDSFGSLSLVFDRRLRVAGSTASAILDREDYDAQLDHALRKKLDVTGDGWFPVGLTAHGDIHRLLTNHFLDLDTWQQVRHWPAKPLRYADDPRTAWQAISDEVLACVETMLASGKTVSMALTAGGDSRMLLSICRPFAEKIRFYTVAGPGSELDIYTARRLAERFGLQYSVLPLRTATPDQMAIWDYRVGHAVATNNRRMFPSVAPLQGHVCVGGLGGEIGRCFLWPNMANVGEVTAEFIADRLKLPRIPEVMTGISKWLEEVEAPDKFMLLDIAYNELRMNSWASAQSYANPTALVLHPLTSRRSIVAMMTIPPEMRQGNRMISDVIGLNWPELLDMPVNRYGNYRDRLRPFQRAVQNPHRAWRKLRQITRERMR